MGRVARSLTEKCSEYVEASRTADFVRWTEQVVRASWLFRWFTTEPDPDVIVIDLRESWTVGPALRLLDWILTPVVAAWRDSRLRGLTERATRLLGDRPIQVVSLAALAAVAASLLALVASGSPTRSAVGARLLVAAVAIAGTRITTPWKKLSDAKTFDVLEALLAPPEPPDEEKTGTD